MNVIFHPLAEDEYWDQCDYYRGIDVDLGNRFECAVTVVIDGIALNPYLCHNRGDGILSVRVRGFPFSVFYAISKGQIIVLSLCHERRNPSVWKNRKK